MEYEDEFAASRVVFMRAVRSKRACRSVELTNFAFPHNGKIKGGKSRPFSLSKIDD